MRRILPLILSVMLLAMLVLPASAQGTEALSLRMKDDNTALEGVRFELYRVGTQNTQGDLMFTGAFADYAVNPDGSGADTSAQANALFAFAKKDSVTPDVAVATQSNGVAYADGLQEGLYLVAGLPFQLNGFQYETEPCLILLPMKDQITGETQRNPVLDVKFSKEPITDTISRKVLKIWDDHSGNVRPQTVIVHLLKDGQVFDTVTLSAEKQWRHTWEGLDAQALWQIVEVVPEHYTVSVDREGNTFLLINTAPELPPPETEPSETVPQETKPTEPPHDDEEKIPQTGMLWWPVMVFGMAGLVLIAVGITLRKEQRHEP